jgi:hypothetical protein
MNVGETAKIYAQMSKVMSEVRAIGKNGKNADDDYTFRRIDDVYNALQPVLAKNGVFFVPSVLESTEEKIGSGKKAQVRVKLKVQYKIFADDGSAIEAIVYGEAIDGSDKAHNKALTAAFKYLLIQVFCIAVSEISDADQSSPGLEFVKEKRATSKKSSGDFQIRDGKYRGKRASEIPRTELLEYLSSLDEMVKSAGRKHPKWFIELQKWMAIA